MALTYAFFRAGMIEAWGRGINDAGPQLRQQRPAGVRGRACAVRRRLLCRGDVDDLGIKLMTRFVRMVHLELHSTHLPMTVSASCEGLYRW